jgi:hypothetical protein
MTKRDGGPRHRLFLFARNVLRSFFRGENGGYSISIPSLTKDENSLEKSRKCAKLLLGQQEKSACYSRFHQYSQPEEISMQVNWKRYGVYLIRWQLSTPILAGVLYVLSGMDKLAATTIANLIGGLIFFWIDKFIFTSELLSVQWEVKDLVVCADCGRKARGYRIVRAEGYDRTGDKMPEFRCEACSKRKTDELRKRGIGV